MNITCQVDNPDPVDIPLAHFISILPSFPNLKYVSLSSMISFSILQIDLNIDTLVIPDNSLNNLLILYIIECPKLTKLVIGNKCLARLDTLRIWNLPRLVSFSIGDESFDDGSGKAFPIGNKEEACTRKLDCKYKNKSLILQCSE